MFDRDDEEEDFQHTLYIAGLNKLIDKGVAVRIAIADEANPFAQMVDRAKDAAINSVAAIVHSNLDSKDGLHEAKRHQSAVLRYLELVTWIEEAAASADEAEEQLVGDTDEVMADFYSEDEEPNGQEIH